MAGDPHAVLPTEPPAAAVLGVEESLGGRRWRARSVDDRHALALAQRTGVPEVVGRILAARGVALDQVEAYLDPTLRRWLPDPLRLKDMERACERLATAVMQGEGIAVFGDYDVDGSTSAALLLRYLAAVGAPARAYVPDRLTEGYGPNEAALLGLGRDGASVIVTVDCGTLSHEPLAAAAAAGLDVIVVDHHTAESRLPHATAVVNPNRLDEDGILGHLAAVGVAFLLAVGVNRVLRQAGWFDHRPEPDLMDSLDLVALGTICDMVPLVGVNRALVSQGLKVMARRGNIGLKALADAAGVDESPGVYHAGYVLGPRINAGGRVGRSDLGARLLSTADAAEAADIAAQLHGLNRERQAVEAAVLDAALAQAEEETATPPGPPVLFAVGEQWHPGVIGLVASRLAERFNRPACAVAVNDGRAVGSGRSVAGIDLGAAVVAAAQAGLLVKGGGHPMAAGFTVDAGRLGELRRFLEQRLAPAVAAADRVPSLGVDGILRLGAATPELVAAVERAGPFGAGNPGPRFAFADVTVAYAREVGQGHLRCTLADGAGGRLEGIAFRSVGTPLGGALQRRDGAPLHVAGRLRLNTWRGRTSVQLHLDDAAPAW